MVEFVLHDAFIATSHAIADLPLCHARLHADARYPWIVLIPRLPGLTEVEDLCPADRARLVEEGVLAGRAVRAVGEVLGLPVTKLNLGALGNVTSQLHLHVVGRRIGDPAWPGPVWGHSDGEPFDAVDLVRAVEAARAILHPPL
jgi:diadenosine tetraphosphate (Ap4A) HIT family hydrolase